MYDAPLVKQAAKKGISILQHSFISLQPNNEPFVGTNNFEWLFFTSPKSARLFSEIYSINSELKLAALSERTKNELEKKFNSQVQFVGGSANVNEIGKAFWASVSDKDRVLFPIGEGSRRSIQKESVSDNWNDFIFYKTEISDKLNINCNFDAVFLSSSTQSRGWLKTSKGLYDYCKVFAFLGSTSRFLETQGITTITVKNFNRECVFNALNSHLGQTD